MRHRADPASPESRISDELAPVRSRNTQLGRMLRTKATRATAPQPSSTKLLGKMPRQMPSLTNLQGVVPADRSVICMGTVGATSFFSSSAADGLRRASFRFDSFGLDEPIECLSDWVVGTTSAGRGNHEFQPLCFRAHCGGAAHKQTVANQAAASSCARTRPATARYLSL